MQKTSLVPTVIASMLAALAVAVPASAAPITIGSPLTAPFGASACFDEPCTVVATGFDEPGAVVTSPVNGTIVRWHILDGAPGFNYRLRVVTPSPSSTFTGSGTSAPASASGPGIQTFPANLPIRAGQMIGLELEANAPIGFLEETADTYAYFAPPLLDGQTLKAEPANGEIAFNAEIQLPPSIAAIAPAAGSFKGGTVVTITGSEFTGATAVSFGVAPASSFTVVSDSQIVAIAPPEPPLAAVPVSVTTPAGTATAATGFRAQACDVPNLKKKKLKAAKKRSRNAHCKIGKVKKIEGATGKTGEVVKQRPKAGKVLAPGAKIRVTLAP